MKTISLKSFFKKVSEKSSDVARAGQKRPDLAWEIQSFEPADLDSLEKEKICKVLDSFVESFGRKLIASKGDDWSFCPTLEEVSFEAAFADLVAERTSSRTLTKESLLAFSKFYQEKMISVLGVPAKAAAAGASLIAEKFKSVAGKNDVLEALSVRISSLVEACVEDSELEAELIPFSEVVDAILSLLDELKKEEISADCL